MLAMCNQCQDNAIGNKDKPIPVALVVKVDFVKYQYAFIVSWGRPYWQWL